MADPPRLPLVDGDDGTWGDILNEFLDVSHNNPDGTLKSSAVSDAGAEMTSNKDTDGTLAANSDTKYPSQKAIKTYVDSNTLSASSIDTDGTLAANSDTKVASQKATKAYVDTKDSGNVKTTGDQSVAGKKTFADDLVVDNGSGKTKVTGSSGAVQEMYSSSSDGQPSISIDAEGTTPSISLGAGGSTAPDVKIQRLDGIGGPATEINTFVTNFSLDNTSGATVVSAGSTSGFYTYNGDFATAMSNNYTTTAIGNLGAAGGALALGPNNGALDTFMERSDTQELTFNDVLLKGAKDPTDAQDVVTKHYVDNSNPETSLRYQDKLTGFWDKLYANTAKVMFFGDSITEGFMIDWDATYPEVFLKLVGDRYGEIADSFIIAGGDGIGPTNKTNVQSVTSGGSPSVAAKGIGSGSVAITNPGSSQTFTSAKNCQVIGFWYKKGPSQGNIKITVDAGAPTIIDAGAATASWGNTWYSTSMTAGVHSIKTEATTGGSYNSGYQVDIEAYIVDPDIVANRVFNVATYGKNTGSWSQASNPGWQAGLSSINPDMAVIFLGTNDMGDTAANFKSRLQTNIIDQLNALANPPIIVLAKFYLNSSLSTMAVLQPFRDAIDELAVSNDNVIVWDLLPVIGNLNISNELSLSAGPDVHPNAQGHYIMGQSLYKLVGPPSSYGLSYGGSPGADVNVKTLTVSGDINLTNPLATIHGNLIGGTDQPPVEVTSSRVVGSADIGKTLFYQGSDSITLTFDSSIVNVLSLGLNFRVANIGIGTVIIAGGSGIAVSGNDRLTSTGEINVKPISTSIITTSYIGSDTSSTGVITTSQTATANQAYLCNSASLITVTLPSTATVGSTLEVTAMGTGGFKIAQNASGVIHFGSSNTTTGTSGYIASTSQYDSIKLVCSVANNEWIVTSSVGNLTVA